jgi:hypothetical protein
MGQPKLVFQATKKQIKTESRTMPITPENLVSDIIAAADESQRFRQRKQANAARVELHKIVGELDRIEATMEAFRPLAFDVSVALASIAVTKDATRKAINWLN